MNTLGWTRQTSYWDDYVSRWGFQRRVARTTDYVAWRIDGQTLREVVPFTGENADDLDTPDRGLVVPLPYAPFDPQRSAWFPDGEYLERAAGRAAPDFNNGRTGLLICDCGDWGCGSLSAFVVRTDEHVEWRDVQWYAYFDPEEGESAAPTGPTFVFDAQQYDQVLADLTAEFAPPKAL